jgi:hypothetical protein
MDYEYKIQNIKDKIHNQLVVSIKDKRQKGKTDNQKAETSNQIPVISQLWHFLRLKGIFPPTFVIYHNIVEMWY